MHNDSMPDDIYPTCRRILSVDDWEGLKTELARRPGLENVDAMRTWADERGLPGYIAELAVLEHMKHVLSAAGIPAEVDAITANPALHLLPLSWENLACLIDKDRDGPAPIPGEEMMMLLKSPSTGEVIVSPASDGDLLALKIVVEGLDADAVARESGTTAGTIERVLDRAVSKGILLAPPSRIRRDASFLSPEITPDGAYVSTDIFTIQWHITQACDLHCKHCYDRSDRSMTTWQQALKVLKDLRDFAKQRNVSGAVSFTGGNPFLHPRFFDIYRAAADLGFYLGILGNPVPREKLERLKAIDEPSFFQVSLEGLPEHNDYIRGEGHFQRTLDFLDVLRDLDIPSRVMLTLTRDNMNQIIPLAEILRGRADLFLFNRLSQVGEGAQLGLPDAASYRIFMEEYLKAAEENPVMGLKDNLLNILMQREGRDLFGGCAGYGCGAAFNFVAVLSDGEVHACRKLPSLIGNINAQSLAEIYESTLARRYRHGSESCCSCSLKPVCGGCLAVSYSAGLDIFRDRDPYCFLRTD